MITWECKTAGCRYTTKQPDGVKEVTHQVRGTEHTMRKRKDAPVSRAS